MHFDGLIRRFSSLPTLQYEEFFLRLQEAMEKKIRPVKEDYLTKMKVFHTSHWFHIMREPRAPFTNVKLTAKEDSIVQELISTIQQLFLVPHRVCYIQLAWMLPGDEILPHYDTLAIYTRTKRFNVILKGEGLQLSVYNGYRPVNIHCETGDIYELNNRALHAAKNVSKSLVVVFVIDFIEADALPITDEDRQVEQFDSTRLPVSSTVIWDY